MGGRLMARTDCPQRESAHCRAIPRDKLLAALGWHYGKLKDSAEYQRAPIYYDRWRNGMSGYRPTTRNWC